MTYSEYTLSTPFDVSTASYDDDERFSVSAQETSTNRHGVFK